jgi:signal transduction histidine kinase
VHTFWKTVKSKATRRAFNHPLDLFSVLLIYSTVPLVICLVFGASRSGFLVAAIITYSFGAAFLAKWLYSSVSKGSAPEFASEPQENKSPVSRICHDLRNSLNVVMGFTDLLSAETTGALNEKQQVYVQNIRAGTRQMLMLLSSKEEGPDLAGSPTPSESLDETARI